MVVHGTTVVLAWLGAALGHCREHAAHSRGLITRSSTLPTGMDGPGVSLVRSTPAHSPSGCRGPMVNSMADEPQDDPTSDLYGRVIALEAIVTRLLASHAQMHPNGVAARMLADIDGVVASVKSRLPEGAEVLRTVMEPHLRHYLTRAKGLRDGETR